MYSDSAACKLLSKFNDKYDLFFNNEIQDYCASKINYGGK